MKYKSILITGSSGRLGKAILSSKLFKTTSLLTPSHHEMDITDRKSVESYFKNNKIDAIIHCAAFTDVKKCESSPQLAINANIVGTSNIAEFANLVNARIIAISTDYVYPCIKGPYSEKDATVPFTVYGWTKLGGECAIKTVKNHCIVRTSFFEPDKITFDTAPNDAYFSKMPIEELARAIKLILEEDFVGTMNIGQDRISIYDAYKKYKKDIKPVSIKDIAFNRAPDSSLDVSLWKKYQNK